MLQIHSSKTEQAVKEDDPLRARISDYLFQRGISLSKPIQCLSPDHSDNHPSMSYFPKGHVLHCFSCGATLDIYDLVAIYELKAKWDSIKNKPVYDFQEAKAKTLEVLGLPADSKVWQPVKHEISELSDETKAQIKSINEQYLSVAQKHLEDPEALAYLSNRGISLATAKQYGLGYLPDWKSVTSFYKNDGKTGQPSKRLIIPTGAESSYLARSIDDNGNFAKMREGQPFFNLNALSLDHLKKDKTVFIVEGEFDALSIIQAGHAAIALSSTANTAKFIKYIQAKLAALGDLFRPRLFIFMDNDQAGQEAQNKLLTALRGQPLEIYACSMLKSFKDANEALVKNRKLFVNELNKAVEKTENDNLKDFDAFVADKANRTAISTGFSYLDQHLDGGLYPQLYTLGAISSLGKTSLILNIADNIAQSGHRVLYFALEMGKNELIAKSLSRTTYQLAQGMPTPEKLNEAARSAREVLKKPANEFKDQLAKSTLLVARDEYGKYTNNIEFYDASEERPDAQAIFDAVKRDVALHPQNKPVVIVDYLQMIKAVKDANTDKEAVTTSINLLKRVAVLNKIPVILISSLNRASYNNGTNTTNYTVNMAAFKESGEIEYSSDVLLALEPTQKSMTNDQLNQFKASPERYVEVTILKNRSGQTGTTSGFKYLPTYNYFENLSKMQTTIENAKANGKEIDDQQTELVKVSRH